MEVGGDAPLSCIWWVCDGGCWRGRPDLGPPWLVAGASGGADRSAWCRRGASPCSGLDVRRGSSRSTCECVRGAFPDIGTQFLRTKVLLVAGDDSAHGCCFLVEGLTEEILHLSRPRVRSPGENLDLPCWIGDDGVIGVVSLLEALLWRFDLLVKAHCLACGVQSGDGGGGVMIG